MDYDFLVKQRARKELRKFIKNHLGGKLQSLKVLCFPGEQALELTQVYDLLGVPRENITCLETDPSIFDKLQRKNLGCEIHLSTLSRFIQANLDRKFDVISLDFMGRLEKNAEDICGLVARGHMSDDCVLYTNFCTGREGTSEKEFYENKVFVLEKKRARFTPFPDDWCSLPEADKTALFDQERNEESAFRASISARGLDTNRSLGITLASAYSILFAELFYNEVSDTTLERLIANAYQHEESVIDFPGYAKISERPRGLDRILILDADDVIREYKRHIVENVPYSYTNSKGTNMYSDMFFVSKDKYIYSLKKVFGDRVYKKRSIFENESHESRLREDKEAREDNLKWIRKAMEWCRLPPQKNFTASVFRRKIAPALIVNFLNTKMRRHRTHFGNESSYRMPPRKAKLYVQQNSLKSSKELSIETGMSIGRIAAWKAHVTMGTYSKAEGQ